ncbi:putative GNAT family acetyltransferase [Taphrina deformans PYCC 5710]|uniref:GNAT family acetyltransferase n=1 Tax=Taphrina deformans (strain PYCC 5710 / ATCC 11124 / CBS 356.35 / IMI 108563 / JCM 9778 / NBRC 8474) TaxID=1097556 RepID=R4X737_TAPDE|nr:putative GNAT family acetyltransferase [Taphrina deformans PYCC 5710]|eukprot:CCG81087.1 putative GNAT family acetyltransferase [Taphrina deformans PYCC 5710]
MSLHIRPAVKDDCQVILKFIQDLALFEKAPDSCVATLEGLESTLGFTGPQYARAIVAETTESRDRVVPVGIAIYFYNYSTWHAAPGIWLEDLYIDPQFRGRGYGTTILRFLAREVKKIGGKRLEWCVLKWNQKAIDVYTGKHVGAEIMEEWQTCRADGDKLDRMASMYDAKSA